LPTSHGQRQNPDPTFSSEMGAARGESTFCPRIIYYIEGHLTHGNH
jgi:hypothetical protein